jgi:hypothetical protein
MGVTKDYMVIAAKQQLYILNMEYVVLVICFIRKYAFFSTTHSIERYENFELAIHYRTQ